MIKNQTSDITFYYLFTLHQQYCLLQSQGTLSSHLDGCPCPCSPHLDKGHSSPNSKKKNQKHFHKREIDSGQVITRKTLVE